MGGYGTYDPLAADPVLEARKALFRRRGLEDATANAGLDQMNARAGERYDTGIGPGPLQGADIELPIAREAQRLTTPRQDVPASSSIARAAAPKPAPTPPSEPSAPPSRIARTSDSMTAARNLAFSGGPEWRGVGGGPRSGAQMEQDLRAHDLINREYRQGTEQNALEDEVRGNPIERAVAARKRTLAYEDLLPADATSRVRFGQGSNDWNLMDYPNQQAGELGAPTMGEARTDRSTIAQAAAKQNPKDVSEAALGMGRGRLAEELDLLRQQLQAEVRSGRRRPEEAEAAWAKASEEVKTLAEIMKSGFPRDDPFASMGATPAAAPAPGYGPTQR